MSDSKSTNNWSIHFSTLAILISLLSVICSAYLALQANDISIQANELAIRSDEHQEKVEMSTLKVGNLRYSEEKNTFSIDLINGYYASYPAYITSLTIYNDQGKGKVENFQKGKSPVVGRGESYPIEIECSEFLNNYADDVYQVAVEVRYLEYSEMNYTSTKSYFDITVENHTIEGIRLMRIEQNSFNLKEE